MKFYQMRHWYKDRKIHALDFYTSDMMVDDSGGRHWTFKKMIQFLLDGKRNKFMTSLNAEGNY